MLNGITSVESRVAPLMVAPSSGANSVAARGESFVDSTPPFVSPAIRVDPIADQVVLEFRDSESGEVLKQVPSPNQVQNAYTSSSRQDASNTVMSSDAMRVDISISGSSSAPRQVENNVQSSQSLGPSVPLGDGDTSSFSV